MYGKSVVWSAVRSSYQISNYFYSNKPNLIENHLTEAVLGEQLFEIREVLIVEHKMSETHIYQIILEVL